MAVKHDQRNRIRPLIVMQDQVCQLERIAVKQATQMHVAISAAASNFENVEGIGDAPEYHAINNSRQSMTVTRIAASNSAVIAKLCIGFPLC